MPMQLGWPKSTKALTVSQVNQLVRQALETSLAECWVVGEISNLRWPPSGHLYFSLKDTHAQIAAVMFRSAGQLLAFRPCPRRHL
jgi:exodeoxyribonuclease VII large subunit